MGKVQQAPSEREWLIMEAVWNGTGGMTSSEIVKAVAAKSDVTERTIRVLLNRLIGKELLRTEKDAADSRVYHYFPTKTKEECLQLKSAQFVESYFHGSSTGAVAAFLKDGEFTDAQLAELESLLRDKKKGDGA